MAIKFLKVLHFAAGDLFCLWPTFAKFTQFNHTLSMSYGIYCIPIVEGLLRELFVILKYQKYRYATKEKNPQRIDKSSYTYKK